MRRSNEHDTVKHESNEDSDGIAWEHWAVLLNLDSGQPLDGRPASASADVLASASSQGPYSKRHRPSPVSEKIYEERRARAAELLRTLSARETQILECLVDGLKSKDIAHRLGTVRKTVENQRAVLLLKLGVPNSTAAVAVAAYAGLGRCEFLRDLEKVATDEPQAKQT